MGKTIKRFLLIASIPFVLYYGAIAMFVIEQGIADNHMEQICINTEMQNGASLETAQNNC